MLNRTIRLIFMSPKIFSSHCSGSMLLFMWCLTGDLEWREARVRMTIVCISLLCRNFLSKDLCIFQQNLLLVTYHIVNLGLSSHFFVFARLGKSLGLEFEVACWQVPVQTPKGQIQKGKGNLASWLSLKSDGPPPYLESYPLHNQSHGLGFPCEETTHEFCFRCLKLDKLLTHDF